MNGRIFFTGNPWPEGHAIDEFRWSAERRGADIWFDLHLVTANYYAEGDIEEDEDTDYETDWLSPGVWGTTGAAQFPQASGIAADFWRAPLPSTKLGESMASSLLLTHHLLTLRKATRHAPSTFTCWAMTQWRIMKFDFPKSKGRTYLTLTGGEGSRSRMPADTNLSMSSEL